MTFFYGFLLGAGVASLVFRFFLATLEAKIAGLEVEIKAEFAKLKRKL